jgi:hypothetical protein
MIETGLIIIGLLYLAMSITVLVTLFLRHRPRRRA